MWRGRRPVNFLLKGQAFFTDFRARPAHPLKDLDWQAFAEFFRKLGMPVLEDSAGPDAYAKLFARHHLTTPEEE